MNILNRPAIKMEARSFIGQQTLWFKMFLSTIIVYLLGNSVTIGMRIYDFFTSSGITYFNGYYNDASDSIGSFSISIITLILIPFMVAIKGYYLNHIRRFNPDCRSLYKEGFDNYGTYLLTGFIMNIFIMLWSFLLVVPGIIKAIAYSQTYFVIHDNNKLSSGEAIKISNIMTRGYKADLFILELSFIPWYLLVGVTFGIASIYVLPYTNVVRAMYYENLKKNAIESGLVAPEAFGIFVNPYENQNNGFDNSQYNDAANSQPTYYTRNPESTFNPDLSATTNYDNNTHTTAFKGESAQSQNVDVTDDVSVDNSRQSDFDDVLENSSNIIMDNKDEDID